MNDSRPQPTLADYVTLAISPVFIMVLVGSLVFFLIDVTYSGEYIERLRWTMFWFVLAIVLIARMTMDAGIAGRAAAYGLVLGAVVLAALSKYVTYAEDSPLAGFGWAVNLGLMAVAWWSAHRLTWDCTFIDERGESSGKGLLQAAGWEQTSDGTSAPLPSAATKASESGGDRTPRKRKKKRKPADATELPGFVGWLERYREFAEENQRKGHTPGIWVVYFSLAALPLFGVGQSLIATDDHVRRQHAFWMMIAYVASGLALLVTTCFVGIRRYLRHKNLVMPASMAAVWLVLGGTLIALFLGLGMLMPRPHPEYPLVNVTALMGSTERDSSRYSPTNENPGKGKGSESDRKQEKGDEGKATEGANPKGGDPKGGQGKGDDQSSDKEKGKSGDSSSKGSDTKQPPGDGKTPPGQDKPKSEVDEYLDERARPMRNLKQSVQEFFSNAGEFCKRIGKWIVYILLGLLAIYLAVRFLLNGLKYLSHFTLWAQRLLSWLEAWWSSLFAGSVSPPRSNRDLTPESEAESALPFSAYANPFEFGHGGRSMEELVAYTFEALDALAREHDQARGPEETPLEFADRLKDGLADLRPEARKLALLHARTFYAREGAPRSAPRQLRSFWEILERQGTGRLQGSFS